MNLEYALIALYIVGFLFIIEKWSLFKFDNVNRKWFQLIFLIKIIAGFGLYWIYTSHYTVRSEADIFKYFDDSKIIHDAFAHSKTHFFKMLFGVNCEGQEFRDLYYDKMTNWYRTYDSLVYNNNRTMIRVNSLLHLISAGSYHIHSIFMCFFSLIGLTLLLKTFSTIVKEHRLYAVILVVLLPSILLWTSGNLKEALLFLFLGSTLFSLKQMISNKKWIYAPLFLVSIYFLFLTKYYVLIALCPVIIGYALSIFTAKRIAIRYLSALVVCILVAFLISSVKPDLHFANLVAGKRNDMIRNAEKMNAQSLYDDFQIEQRWETVIFYIPKSLVQAIIQPFPHTKSTFFQLLAFAENLFIISFLIYCIFRSRAGPNLEFVWFIALFVIVLYIILGLTTPVAGALVRYKVPGLAMLMILCLLLINKMSLKTLFLKN